LNVFPFWRIGSAPTLDTYLALDGSYFALREWLSMAPLICYVASTLPATTNLKIGGSDGLKSHRINYYRRWIVAGIETNRSNLC
jgi:hypothetical protein